MKKLITLSLVMAMAVPTLALANSPVPPTTPVTLPAIVTSGGAITSSTAVTPIISIDRDTLEEIVPARATAEALGYEVVWNANEKSVLFIKGDEIFKATSGSNIYSHNGESFQLETATTIIEGTSYVPVSFVELLK